MLKVHSKQMAACAEVSTQSFAEKILRHLACALPAPCAAMGLSAVESMVQNGISSALSHGITARKDVTLFLAATAALGEGFTESLPWAAELLGDGNPLAPATRVKQLWSVVESDFLPEQTAQSGAGSAPPSVALAVELSEAAKTDLAGPLPVNRPVVPCPLRPRTYPFSL